MPHDTGHLSDMKPGFLVHWGVKGAARRAAGGVGTRAVKWDGEVPRLISRWACSDGIVPVGYDLSLLLALLAHDDAAAVA